MIVLSSVAVSSSGTLSRWQSLSGTLPAYSLLFLEVLQQPLCQCLWPRTSRGFSTSAFNSALSMAGSNSVGDALITAVWNATMLQVGTVKRRTRQRTRASWWQRARERLRHRRGSRRHPSLKAKSRRAPDISVLGDHHLTKGAHRLGAGTVDRELAVRYRRCWQHRQLHDGRIAGPAFC